MKKLFKMTKTTVLLKTMHTQEDDGEPRERNGSEAGSGSNESKCKVQRITRKLNPVIASYELNEHALGISTVEKDRGVVIYDKLS